MANSLSVVCFVLYFARSGVHCTENTYLNDTQFVCNFDPESGGLVIKYGFKEENVIKCLKTFSSATFLSLTQSGLKTIPEYIEQLRDVVHLDLSNNSISDVNFGGLPNVCRQLKTLRLDYNVIKALRRGQFDCLVSLEEFSITNNTLSIIENGTFTEKLKSIRTMRFNGNSLTAIDSSLLSSLKKIDRGKLRLYMSWNNISYLTNSANFTIDDVTPKKPIWINAVHNNFTHFDLNFYAKMFNFTNTTSLYNLFYSGIDARFNPFMCNCKLYPLSKILRIFHWMDRDNPVFSITCGSPLPLKAMLVREVPDNQFNCSVSLDCPKNCSCIETVALNFTKVECLNNYLNNDLPAQCPKAEHLNLQIHSGHLVAVSPRSYLAYIRVFDVSQSAISNIHPVIMKYLENITFVHLHDNNLHTIPRAMETYNFKTTKVLTLHGNPFDCDCHTLWFKRWVQKNVANIPYQEKIICASGPGKGQPLVRVPDEKFSCNITLSLIQVLVITVGSVVFVLVILVSVLCNRTRIIVLLASYCNIHLFRKRMKSDFPYDVFISHSCEDDDVIGTIVEKLESHDPPYKVCLGERDFEVGKTIPENVVAAIETSMTTVVFLSNNFLQSEWCNLEFRVAYTTYLGRHQSRCLILVILEDLNEELLCKELKTYMALRIYIKFTDKHFWSKLLNALPIRETNNVNETANLIANN